MLNTHKNVKHESKQTRGGSQEAARERKQSLALIVRTPTSERMEVLVARLVYLSHFDLFRNEARREYVATTHARRKFTSDSHQIIIGVSSDSLFDSHRIVFSIVFSIVFLLVFLVVSLIVFSIAFSVVFSIVFLGWDLD